MSFRFLIPGSSLTGPKVPVLAISLSGASDCLTVCLNLAGEGEIQFNVRSFPRRLVINVMSAQLAPTSETRDNRSCRFMFCEVK